MTVNLETYRQQAEPAVEVTHDGLLDENFLLADRFDALVAYLDGFDDTFDNDTLEVPGPDAEANFEAIREDADAMRAILEAAAEELDADPVPSDEQRLNIAESAYEAWRQHEYDAALRAYGHAA